MRFRIQVEVCFRKIVIFRKFDTLLKVTADEILCMTNGLYLNVNGDIHINVIPIRQKIYLI